MKQITIIVDDRVGILADLSYLLGKMKVNIEALSAEVHGGKAVINILVSDEKRANAVLKSNGYHILSEEMLVIKVKDEPGALSEISKKLQKAKINIESLYLLARGSGFSLDALKVDKPKMARKVLADYIIKAK